MNKLKVKVTAYKQNIIIETLDEKKDKNFIPVGGTRIGSVLIETNEFLGMSKEAVTLLKTLKKSHDDIGDISTWKTNDNKDCFAWIGNFKKIVNINKAEGDRDGIIDIKHITIENDVPKEAMNVIDNDL
jgi:hypothetical protein